MSATPAWNEDVIVVTGYARTGTTLMQGLLCASPDVMPVSAESLILRDLAIAYARSKEQWLDYSRHYFPDPVAMRAYHRMGAANWMEYVRTWFKTDKRLLQKLPQSAALYLPHLAHLLPNARFVVMLRDLRDVVASQRERHRVAKQEFDVDKEIRTYVMLYEKLAHAKPLSGRLAFVPYERLVRDPEATVEVVARFLGVVPPADVRSLEWSHVRVPEVSTWSPLDGRPVSAERVGRYRSETPAAMLAGIDRQRANIEKRIGFPVFVDGDGAPGPVAFP